MGLGETLFIGTARRKFIRLPLKKILSHFDTVRETIAATGHFNTQELEHLVANALFIYAFNSYKSIGLLLPHAYFESGSVVLRQLWEVSLNLHWVSASPGDRTRAFCDFTAIEYRNLLNRFGSADDLSEFDLATERFQSRFHYSDKRGRNRIQTSFVGANIFERAEELGDPWLSEYRLVYNLGSMHAHGAPGAILQGLFQQHYGNASEREQNSAALVAMFAIRTIVRDMHLLVEMGLVPECEIVDLAYEEFCSTVEAVSGGNDWQR